jgi:flavodoxin
MIKRLTAIILSIFLLSVLSACGNSVSLPNDTKSSVKQTQIAIEETADEVANESGEEDAAVDRNKILVVYFSCTGTTESLARYAADILGADVYEIVPEEPYTDADLAYYTGGRADQEQNDPDARPAISGSVENMDKYDTIILGYPIWHGQAPRIISTFLESYDFSGKLIVPFCTSHSSGVGSSADNLHLLCADSTEWKEGMRFGGETGKDSIEEWLTDVGLR